MDKEFEINQANKIKSKYVCDIVLQEESPYTLYCASDICSILEISNIRSITINYNKEYKVKLLHLLTFQTPIIYKPFYK